MVSLNTAMNQEVIPILLRPVSGSRILIGIKPRTIGKMVAAETLMTMLAEDFFISFDVFCEMFKEKTRRACYLQTYRRRLLYKDIFSGELYVNIAEYFDENPDLLWYHLYVSPRASTLAEKPEQEITLTDRLLPFVLLCRKDITNSDLYIPALKLLAQPWLVPIIIDGEVFFIPVDDSHICYIPLDDSDLVALYTRHITMLRKYNRYRQYQLRKCLPSEIIGTPYGRGIKTTRIIDLVQFMKGFKHTNAQGEITEADIEKMIKTADIRKSALSALVSEAEMLNTNRQPVAALN